MRMTPNICRGRSEEALSPAFAHFESTPIFPVTIFISRVRYDFSPVAAAYAAFSPTRCPAQPVLR